MERQQAGEGEFPPRRTVEGESRGPVLLRGPFSPAPRDDIYVLFVFFYFVLFGETRNHKTELYRVHSPVLEPDDDDVELLRVEYFQQAAEQLPHG